MRIKLKELKKAIDQPLKRDEAVVLKDVEQELPGLVELKPIHVQVEIQGHQDIYRVQAEQTAELVLACSRCLEPVKISLQSKWHRLFTDQPDRAEDTEEREVLLVPGNEVDLLPYIRETFFLNIPFTVICNEACKGLCPECGIDRNKEDCSCNTERIDPRLAGLKALLKNEK